MSAGERTAGESPVPGESSEATSGHGTTNETAGSPPEAGPTGAPRGPAPAGGPVEAEEVEMEEAKKKKGKGTKRGVETMFRTSYRQGMDLSSLADNKANIMISINGIIISVLIASISPKIDTNPWLLLPTSALLLGCMVSMIFAVLAARPRVSRRGDVSLEDVRNAETNILFFGNFTQMSEEEYVEGMNELMENREALYTNMIRDVYGLGVVLERKFRFLRLAYNVFMASLVAGVILFLGVFGAVTVWGQTPIPLP